MVILCLSPCLLCVLLLLLCYGSIQYSSIRRKRYWILGIWYALLWCLYFRSQWCACIQTFHSYLGWYLLLRPLCIFLLLFLLALQCNIQERDCSPIHPNFLNESMLCDLFLHLFNC